MGIFAPKFRHMEIKDRLKMLQDEQKMSQKEFAKLLGIAEGSLSGIYLGRTNPTNNHTMAVHRAFPNININWLLFGEGDMYKESSPQETDEMPSLFAQPAEARLGVQALKDGPKPAMPPQDPAKPFPVPPAEVLRRNVKEIRVFYDDGTYEAFVPSK